MFDSVSLVLIDNANEIYNYNLVLKEILLLNYTSLYLYINLLSSAHYYLVLNKTHWAIILNQNCSCQ